jgi:hypothetical protein
MLDPKGSPALSFGDGKEVERVQFAMDEKGVPHLLLKDEKNKVVWEAR